jgi:hypothetical protein
MIIAILACRMRDTSFPQASHPISAFSGGFPDDARCGRVPVARTPGFVLHLIKVPSKQLLVRLRVAPQRLASPARRQQPETSRARIFGRALNQAEAQRQPGQVRAGCAIRSLETDEKSGDERLGSLYLNN